MSRALFLSALVLVVLAPPLFLHAAQAQEADLATKPRLARPLQEGVEVRLRSGLGVVDPDAVDESALRYHASRGDYASVEAEIARLRAAQPGWEPPSDLFAPASSVDEQPLWKLYDAGDYAGVRAEIARLAKAYPDWKAPQRLLDLVEENEVRAELQMLEDAKEWERLLAFAGAHPAQVNCTRIDNMWRVADAHAALGNRAQLYQTYASIIGQCADVDQRIATLQKAHAGLPKEEVERLFGLEDQREKPAADAKRLAELRATMMKPETPAPIERLLAGDVSPQQARQAEAAVLSERHAAGAERLAWIAFDAGMWSSARDWFKRALAWRPTAKAAEGLARAHAKLGAYQQVEALAASWPEAVGPLLESLRLEWITRAYEQGDHRTVLAQTAALATPAAWNLRAWTYLQLERPTEAALAFDRVLNDDRAQPSERRDAAFGLARTHLAYGNLDDALLMTRVHLLTRAQIQEVRAEVLARRAAAAFEHKDYQTSLALFEERRSLAEPSRDLLIQEAWTRYHLKQRQIARRMFTDLDRVYSTHETREGLKVLDQAMNRFGS